MAGWFLLFAFAVMTSDPAEDSPDKARFQIVQLTGRVVPYAQQLKSKFGIELESTQADNLLALACDDGRLLPIFPTPSAQFFYLDRQTHYRQVLVTGRIYENTPGLHLLDIYTVKDGKVLEVYYWCGICSIKSYANRPCECCQEPVELREDPTGRSLPKNTSDDPR